METVMDRPAIQYLGRDLVVLYQRQPGSDCVYVTFDYMRPERTNAKPLAGWVLAKLGYSQLHVFASSNNWFQSSEMEDVIKVLRTVMAAYGRRVLWGSSMGGFAALQFADRLAADAVLACAPQISVDPRKVSWDLRFRAEAENIPAFLYDDIPGRSLPFDTYVAFDPGQWHDLLNARAIQRAHPTVRSIVIPFSGHEPTMFMVKQGMIEPVLNGLASGSLDLPNLASARRSSRRAYPRYLEAVQEYRRTRADSPGRFAARAVAQRAGAAPSLPSSSSNWGPDRTQVRRGASDRTLSLKTDEAEPEYHASVAAFQKERDTLLEAARAERQELLRILLLERQRAIDAVRDAHRERDATAAAATAERDGLVHSARDEREAIVRSAREERDAMIRFACEERDGLIRQLQAAIADGHRRLQEAEIANAQTRERLESDLRQARAEAQRARDSEAQARRGDAATRDMVCELQSDLARLVERVTANADSQT